MTSNNKLIIPVSIVIGAIIIGGAIIYKGTPAQPDSNISEQTKTKLDYVQLAGDLGLDTDQFNQCFEDQKYQDEVVADFQDGAAAGVESTPTTFVNGRKVLGSYPGVYQDIADLIEEELANPSPFEAPLAENDTVLGDASAPVLIIEFGDFQCPYCGDLYRRAEEKIIENYVETGKAKLVYRDFPLYTIHPSAIPAALAAECAKEQGAYWQYHDALFENQERL